MIADLKNLEYIPCFPATILQFIMSFVTHIYLLSQRTLTMFVEVAALCYQHCAMWRGVDNEVPQLPQT